MTLLTKATINLAATVTFGPLHPPVRKRAGVLESVQTDVLTLCITQWRRPLHWFTQEHFYEKPRNVFMQIDGHKSKVLF
jgi:hypothetical protein